MANFPLPKGYQRLGKFPIDETEIFTSEASARAYAVSPSAYPGQKISVVKDASNAVDVYTILPDGSLAAIGGSTTSLTADNGLTITDNVVELGGTLNKPSTIDVNGLNLNLKTSVYSMNIGTGFDDKVNCIIKDSNGKYVVVGDFTEYNGVTSIGIVRFNQDGTLDSTFVIGTGFDGGSVNKIIEDSNGKYVVVGYFSEYNGISTSCIARLNQDGTLDSTFVIGTGFNNYIYSVIEDSNGKYVVVGSFTTYKGVAQNRIARLNQDGTLDSTFVIGTGFNNDVHSIIEDLNGKYVIGGWFGTYNSTSKTGIIRLNQDGTLDTNFITGTGLLGVTAINQDSFGKYIIGGNFITYNSVPAKRIIRLNQNGSLDGTFNVIGGFNDAVNVIQIDEFNNYYLGGWFTEFNGIDHKRIIKLNYYGNVEYSWNSGVGCDDEVTTIFINNDYILIGGWFTEYNLVSSNSLVQLSINGSIIDSDKTYIVKYDKVLSYNGDYSEYFKENSLVDKNYVDNGPYFKNGGSGYNDIVWNIHDSSLNFNYIKLSWNTGEGLSNGINYNVGGYKIIQDSNSKFVIVGNFTKYNNYDSNMIIRLNSDSTIDTSFDISTGFNNIVSSIIQDSNGKYVVYGKFTTYKGVSQNGIARLNQDGTLDSTFVIGTGFNASPTFSFNIASLIQDSNGKYVVCGYFTTYKGVAQNRIARLNQDGTLDSTFVIGTGFNSDIYSVIEDSNGKYVVVGSFTTYKGVAQNRIARLNQDGTLDSTFVIGSGFNSVIYSVIEDSNDKYLVGGRFTTYKGVSQNGIARLNQDGTLDSTFITNFGINDGIYNINNDSSNNIIIGGDFYDQYQRNSLFKLNQDGSIINRPEPYIQSRVLNTLINNDNIYVTGTFKYEFQSISNNSIVKLNYDLTPDMYDTYNMIHKETIQYGDDYSSLYTDRSLVDKAYVNKLIADPSINAPTEPIAGTIYFDVSTSHFYGYDGTIWKQLDN